MSADEIALEEEDFGPEERMIDPFDPNEIDVISETISLSSIVERIRHDEINMETDFQREAGLWGNAQMSSLIESILIRFPLPVFYFDASNPDEWEIVDGLQRLTAIKRFIIDQDYALSQLEFLSELNGKKYADLSRKYHRILNECQILTYQIRPGTPKEVKYSIFRRINTGGMLLNHQEIRHALSHKRERQFLKDCAELEHMQRLMPSASKRMKNRELALRFFAFYLQDYTSVKNNLTLFLDAGLELISEKSDQEQAELIAIFDKALRSAEAIFGEHAFEKNLMSNSRSRSKNASLYEVWTVSLADCTDEEQACLIERKELVLERFKALLTEKEGPANQISFFDAISYQTQKQSNIQLRYQKIAHLIHEVLHA